MAVTNYALAGVSENTQKKLQQAQTPYQQSTVAKAMQQKAADVAAAKPGEYKEGDAVIAARNSMNQVQARKPQGFTSKYSDQLESILQQIQNPEKFKYEFNGDNLFKAYSDMYTQQGKQAALDVQGQAAALTGGYGNSYSQGVGQQTYQQYLTALYDKGMDMQAAAYQRYLDEQNAIKDRYNIVKNADDTDYGRYQDTLADWRSDLDYATNMYNTERNTDYGRYRDRYGDWQTAEEQAYSRAKAQEQLDYDRYQMDLNYWTGLAQIENNAYMTEQERQEAIRQFNLEYQLKLDQWEWEKANAGGGGGGGGGKSKKEETSQVPEETQRLLHELTHEVSQAKVNKANISYDRNSLYGTTTNNNTSKSNNNKTDFLNITSAVKNYKSKKNGNNK